MQQCAETENEFLSRWPKDGQREVHGFDNALSEGLVLSPASSEDVVVESLGDICDSVVEETVVWEQWIHDAV